MSKKYENLDHLILGDKTLDIDLDGNAEVEQVSTESETEVKNTSKVIENDMIDLDEEEEEVVETEPETKVEGETEEAADTEEVKEEEQQPQDQKEILNHWSNYFKESSILSDEDLEGFDGSIEALTKAFEKREERVGMEMVESYKSQLPFELKYLADNWEQGVPFTDLLNIKSNQIKYAGVTDEKLEESVDTQKAIVSEYLKRTTKFSDSKREKEVNRLLDLDELKDEAKEALVELKKIEAEAEDTLRKETKKEQERRMEENYKLLQTYEKTSKEIKEVIPGIKLTEKEQKEIFDKATNPVGIDGNGNQVSYAQSLRNEDPIGFDLKLSYILAITKNLKDFSKITNTITTKATKDLSNILNTPLPSAKKDNISTSGKKSMLELLEMQNKSKSKK